MNIEKAVENLIRGGPRASRNAWEYVERALRSGEKIDLPEPEDVRPENRILVLHLHFVQWCEERDWDALDRAWKSATNLEKRYALGAYHYAPHYEPKPLFDHARSCLDSDDPELMGPAYLLLGSWLKKGREPFEEILGALLDGLSKKGRSKYYGYSLATECRHQILLASTGAAADRLVAFFTPRLEAKKAADRKMAAAFFAARARDLKDTPGLERLLLHPNKTVRNTVSWYMEPGCVVAAKNNLLMATEMAPKAREAVADAVARRMERKLVKDASQELLRARSHLFDTDPTVRKEALTGLARLASLDRQDIRAAAPHIALALFDQDEGVREEAASTVSYLCDRHGSTRIVQSLEHLIKRARSSFRGKSRKYLDVALGALHKKG